MRDVAVAPEAVAAKLRSRVGQRPKRALGVIKVSPEWKGVISGSTFEIWEKQQHATRMVGRIKARRGGARVEARLEVRRRTWVMMGILFILFAYVSLGLLQRETGMGMGPPGISLAVLGALVLLTFFWSASMRQRALLKGLLDEVLDAAERG